MAIFILDYLQLYYKLLLLIYFLSVLTDILILTLRVYRLHERLVNLRSEYNLRLKSGVTATQIPMTQIHSVQVLQQAPVRLRPELDEVTLHYIQDLLGWVEENQRRVDDGEWGSDLPAVECQLGSHRGLHQSVEEFRSKIERAKADEVQTADMKYEEIFQEAYSREMLVPDLNHRSHLRFVQ